MNEKNWKLRRRQILADLSAFKFYPSPPSGRETLAAGAVGHRVGIGHFESALLQIIAVVEFRTADKKGALGINHDVHTLRGNKDVTRNGAIDQVHLVLEAGAAAADDRHAERAIWTALLGEERCETIGCGIRDAAELLIPDLVGKGRCGCCDGFGHGGNLIGLCRAVKCLNKFSSA